MNLTLIFDSRKMQQNCEGISTSFAEVNGPAGVVAVFNTSRYEFISEIHKYNKKSNRLGHDSNSAE